jgi:hypothetical protein
MTRAAEAAAIDAFLAQHAPTICPPAFAAPSAHLAMPLPPRLPEPQPQQAAARQKQRQQQRSREMRAAVAVLKSAGHVVRRNPRYHVDGKPMTATELRALAAALAGPARG